MRCVTHIRVKATEASRNLLAFDLSGRMHATSAKVDGEPAEVYERDSIRSGLVQNTGNELLLLLPAKPLEPGSEHDIEIAHEGKVVQDAGHQVYFVSARGSWYPSRGVQFASYDVTWRYPATLQLVSPGKIADDRTEGDTQVTRRIPEGPVRIWDSTSVSTSGRIRPAMASRSRFWQINRWRMRFVPNSRIRRSPRSRRYYGANRRARKMRIPLRTR